MSDTEIARLFQHDGGQAVCLPKAFRLPSTEVRVRRLGTGVLLEPFESSHDRTATIFAEIDRLGGANFLA